MWATLAIYWQELLGLWLFIALLAFALVPEARRR